METALAAEFFLSDGIVLTGKTTGNAIRKSDFIKIQNSCSLPIVIGSGVTAENVADFLNANAIIVGSYFKKEGL